MITTDQDNDDVATSLFYFMTNGRTTGTTPRRVRSEHIRSRLSTNGRKIPPNLGHFLHLCSLYPAAVDMANVTLPETIT